MAFNGVSELDNINSIASISCLWPINDAYCDHTMQVRQDLVVEYRSMKTLCNRLEAASVTFWVSLLRLNVEIDHGIKWLTLT